MNTLSIGVVIPVYNEKGTIEEILKKVEAQPMVSEIVVVDDNSNDGTKEMLKKYAGLDKYKIIFGEINSGKGASLRLGFKAAKSDVIIVQDADLEYDPNDYSLLLDPILTDKADVVFGSRFLGGPHRIMYFWHYMVNIFLTLLPNMINNLNLTDMEVCYKVFRKSVLDKIELKSDRFGFEPEITAKVAKLKVRIYEVPVRYYGRTYEEGKKIGWLDGVAALWWILRFGFFK